MRRNRLSCCVSANVNDLSGRKIIGSVARSGHKRGGRCQEPGVCLLTVGHDHGRGDSQGLVDDSPSQIYGEKDHVPPGGGLVGPVRRLEEHWLREYGTY